MIVDHIKNIEKYAYLNPNIMIAVQFMKHNNLLELQTGKHEIAGSKVFLLRDTYIPKSIESCYFEGHRQYLDIQIVLKGYEYFGYSNIHNPKIKITQPYLIDKDIEKYDITDFSKIILTENMFVIVFPDDLHMPKLLKDHEVTVEKAVFKVKL